MSDSPFRARLLGALGVLGLFALFVATGLRGLDFGKHWDEDIQRRAVMRSAERGTVLPGFYKYPSVSYAISCAAVLPAVLEHTALSDQDVPGTLELDAPAVVRHVESRAYLLRARTLFLLASALSVLWIALAARAAGASVWSALFAAGLMATSWELAYHARWIAPDTVMVQFTALCLAALLAAGGSARTSLLCLLAAGAAGLAAGTKYPGGILLFAVVPAGVFFANREGRSLLAAGLGTFACFALAYLASTPGTVLEPLVFWNDVAYEAMHYSRGHWGFTVEPGLEHAARAARYASLDLLSDHAVFGATCTALAVVGAARVWRESRPLFAVLVALPVVYFVYLATKRVMFVRNLLFLAPFAALLAARGAGWLTALLPRPAGVAFAALLGLGVAANAWTLVAAGEEIRDRGPAALGVALAEHLRENPGARYHLTAGARRCLVEAGEAVPAHAEHAEDAAERIACVPDDLRRHLMWPANRPTGLIAALGPRSVNYAWYTTWDEPWVAVVTPELAERVRTVRWHPRDE